MEVIPEMPTRPAVEGLLKHQLMITHAALESDVLTIWTWKDEYPIPGARVTAERTEIEAWVSASWKVSASGNAYAERIKTWDFGESPPSKYSDKLIFPRVQGVGGSAVWNGWAAVVALRSEPVGSIVRNRLNGRVYHPIGANYVNGVNGDLLNTATVAGHFNALRDRLDPGTHADCGDWVVPSFFHDNAVRPVPVMIPVNHCLVAAGFAAVQRRRLTRRAAYPRGA